MSLLERVRGWLQDRRRREDEELAAEVRGEVHDPREGRREGRPDEAPEENPFGTSGVGFYGPRSDLD
jgi:hypothetical protein